jgi:hypothetical protein
MNFILYDNNTGRIIQLRGCANIDSIENMIQHVYGETPPAMISCMPTEYQDFPLGKKIDLETGLMVDAGITISP